MWCSAVYRYSIIICDGTTWTCIGILRHERHLKRRLHRVNPKVHEHSYKQSFFAVNNHFPGPVDKNEADSVIQWVVSYYKIIRKPQMFHLTLPTDPSVLYLRFSDGILQMHIVMFPQEHCDHSVLFFQSLCIPTTSTGHHFPPGRQDVAGWSQGKRLPSRQGLSLSGQRSDWWKDAPSWVWGG